MNEPWPGQTHCTFLSSIFPAHTHCTLRGNTALVTKTAFQHCDQQYSAGIAQLLTLFAGFQLLLYALGKPCCKTALA
jgi:hypothetical protein